MGPERDVDHRQGYAGESPDSRASPHPAPDVCLAAKALPNLTVG
jgi:hypothetical protein